MADDFYAELERRDAELEAARAAKDDDPEGWAEVSRAYSEWRIGIRLLGGRPTGDAVGHPVIAKFLADNPGHPRQNDPVVNPMVKVEES